jgi:hypothetical protein
VEALGCSEQHGTCELPPKTVRLFLEGHLRWRWDLVGTPAGSQPRRFILLQIIIVLIKGSKDFFYFHSFSRELFLAPSRLKRTFCFSDDRRHFPCQLALGIIYLSTHTCVQPYARRNISCQLFLGIVRAPLHSPSSSQSATARGPARRRPHASVSLLAGPAFGSLGVICATATL